METDAVLGHCRMVLSGREEANFRVLKRVPVSFDREWSTEKLLKVHSEAMKDQEPEKGELEQNLLELKTLLAERVLETGDGTERGYGGVVWVAEEGIERWDELDTDIHRIRTAGCNLSCVFCRHWKISQRDRIGEPLKPIQVAFRIAQRYHEGGKAVAWGHSDPMGHIPPILRTLTHLKVNIPQIWKTNLQYPGELIEVLRGVPDLIYIDYTFGSDDCALRLAGVKDYTDRIRNAIKTLAADSHMHDMVIHHLSLPNHKECCTKEVLSWIAETVPDIAVRVDTGYGADYRAWVYKDISRPLSDREIQEIYELSATYGKR